MAFLCCCVGTNFKCDALNRRIDSVIAAKNFRLEQNYITLEKVPRCDKEVR